LETNFGREGSILKAIREPFLEIRHILDVEIVMERNLQENQNIGKKVWSQSRLLLGDYFLA
jgi:hypothetical protein